MDLLQLKRVGHFFGWGAETPKADKPVKIGLLGASQVGNYALVWPAKRVAKAEVVAVAARDSKRALDYARQHGIPRYYGSYDQLLADPEIDAVYVGLPNGLHGHWTRKALKAGKHVLCEKPFAANQHEVREVQALARSKGLLCREAFHYREHPMAARLRELVLGETSSDSGLPVWLQPPALPGGQGGTLGQILSIDVKLLIPHWVFGGHNIRFQDQLAGGAMMDAGCYCASMLRLLSGAEPQVASATAELFNGSTVTDGAMRARVSWPTLPGLQGTLHASLKHDGWVPETEVTVTGTKGTLHCTGFVMPFFGHTIRMTRTVPCFQPSPSPESTLISQPFSQAALELPTASLSMSSQPTPKFQRTNTTMSVSQQQGGAAALLAPSGLGIEALTMESVEEWVEHAYGTEQETTYYHQLERFATDLHVLKGHSKAKSLASVQAACAGDQSDALANQALVDAVYEAAGLPVRTPTKVPGLPAP